MKRLNIAILTTVLLALFVAGCDKDPLFKEGDYLYNHRGELQYLENFNGILINWNEFNGTDEQKEVISEIVSNMVRGEGGTFQMGSDDELAATDEQPVHAVTLSSFRINKFTVTQKQWRVLMGTDLGWNSNYGLGDEFPATYMSYNDCKNFVQRLNTLTGLHFRLPTEAEWEYAARGGKQSHGTLYSGSDNPDEVAWHQGNAGNVLHWPGSLRPNELGLYDMSGNIWEWCSDRYGNYSADAQTNPTGPSGGNRCVIRGGSISFEASYSRVSQRNSLEPGYRSFVTGFRVAMDEIK